MSKDNFIEYLAEEIREYHNILPTEKAKKDGKRMYINGLMKASRFFGVEYGELEKVIRQYQDTVNNVGYNGSLEFLDIPTFLRLNKSDSL